MGSRRSEGELAVFTRNHKEYLVEETERISAQNPSATTVFRAKAFWATARRQLPRGGSLPIYMAEVGGGGAVEYTAELCHVQLHPRRGVPETEALLVDFPQALVLCRF